MEMSRKVASKEMAEFFKSKTEYKRLLKGIKNKYISLGEIKGNVVINSPDEPERQALSGLMKKDYSKNKSISINLKVLQQRIDNSKFSGADLKEILYEYFSEDIVTNKENKGQYEIDLAEFFDDILDLNIHTKVYDYLKDIIITKNTLYQKWKKYYNKDKNELKIALLNACNGINNLPKERTRIPVFASKVTGNPHEFDKNTLSGKLFIMLICYIKNISIPQSTEELAEVYYDNNLLIDDVSNMILCRNIIGFTKGEEVCEYGQMCTSYKQHLGLKGFAKYNEPIYLNLYNLSNIGFLTKYDEYDKVVVVENPAVFMAIGEKCKRKDFPVVCTYGQVKLSGLMLLDMLVEQKYTIYYSGDIDPEGIGIADKLKSRYKENLHFFGFDVDTYKKNLSDVEISISRLKKLDKIKSRELQDVCHQLKLIKKASYEEKNIDAIIEFIEK